MAGEAQLSDPVRAYIYTLRKRRGLTQNDVADGAGLKRRTYIAWENGETERISPADLSSLKILPGSAGHDQATPTMTIAVGGRKRRMAIESVTTTVKSRQFDPCPDGFCDGSGWYKEAVPFGHPNFAKLFPCACRQATQEQRDRERRRLRLAQLEGEMGGELMGCTLHNYDLHRARDSRARRTKEAALATCRAYAAHPIGWLYLYGPTGVGKSHLAAGTARAIVESMGTTIAYISEPALMKYLRDGWGHKGEDSTDARIELLQTVDLLIIDDLGTEHRGRSDAAWADAQLLAILMPRYQFERSTIITANFPLDDIDEPRIRSRIKGRTSQDYTGSEQCLLVQNSDQRNGRKQ